MTAKQESDVNIARGNASISGRASDTGLSIYRYDAFNRLIKYNSGSAEASYTYNVDNLRTSKTVNREKTDFVWNGQNLAMECNPNIVSAYTYDMTGIHIANSNGTVNSYLKDYHGNVVGKANKSGSMIQDAYERMDYDAFGNQLNGNVPDPFGYCGEYYDNESGLIYLRARYYDAAAGRFVSEDKYWTLDNMIYGDNQKAVKYAIVNNEQVYFDSNDKAVKSKTCHPIINETLSIANNSAKQDNTLQFFYIQQMPDVNAIKQSTNLYVYVMNNPIKYTDPSGETTNTLTWGGTTFWLVGIDGPLPIGDIIYVGGIGACVIIDGIALFSKGGKQNKRSSEYQNVSDEELDKRYKDPNTPKSEKQKIKTEQKARKTRHSSQKK